VKVKVPKKEEIEIQIADVTALEFKAALRPYEEKYGLRSEGFYQTHRLWCAKARGWFLCIS